MLNSVTKANSPEDSHMLLAWLTNKGRTNNCRKPGKTRRLHLEVLENRTLLSSTLAYWRFEDGTGTTAADSSGNGNTGTLENGALFSTNTPLTNVPRTGAANTGSVQLNGTNQSVVIPDSPTLEPTTAITLEAWVELTSANGTAAIVSRQFSSGAVDSYQIGFRPNLFFGLTNASGQPQTIDTNTSVALNQWHHVAGTWDGSTMRLYLDGNQIGSAPFSGPIGYLASNPVIIGADEDGSGGNPDCCFLPGNLDEVRISDVALTPAQFLNAPPTFTHFTVSLPSSATAGDNLSMTVTALDETNSTATGYRGMVHFTSSDPQAVLPGDYTFSAADNGMHTFSATLKTAGSQSITATDTLNPVAYYRFEEGNGTSVTDTVDGLVEGTHNASYSADFPTSPIPWTGAANQFSLYFDGSTSARVTDQPFILHNTYGDATLEFWVKNTVPSGESDVFWTREDASDTNRFNIYLDPNGLMGVDYREPGGADRVLMLPSTDHVVVPANTWAHIAITRIVDSPTQHTYRFYKDGTLLYTSIDYNPNLPTSTTWTVTGGRSTSMFTGLVDEIRFADKELSSSEFLNIQPATGSSSVSVSPAAASSLVVAGFPSPTTSGAQGSFTVTAVDPYGNTATSYRGTVHFTSSDKRATLPKNYTFTAGDNGTHTFRAVLRTVGTQSLTAFDRRNPSISGTQLGIVVQKSHMSAFFGALDPALLLDGSRFEQTEPAFSGNTRVLDSSPAAARSGECDQPVQLDHDVSLNSATEYRNWVLSNPAASSGSLLNESLSESDGPVWIVHSASFSDSLV
jgi:hypothetical protein